MDNIYGIPVIENKLLPEGTAFLVVQHKGIVTQMEQVYPTPISKYSTADLIAELERRIRVEKCSKCERKNNGNYCRVCKWEFTGGDNFKEATK